MTIEYLARAALHGNVPPHAAAMASDYLAGDILAGDALSDWTKENESVSDYPFHVGDRVFFHHITLYYVGEITEIGRGWVRLKHAHWVHRTARLSSLFRTFDLASLHGGRRPRVEYLGDYVVWLQAGVGCKIWLGDLPEEQIQ